MRSNWQRKPRTLAALLCYIHNVSHIFIVWIRGGGAAPHHTLSYLRRSFARVVRLQICCGCCSEYWCSRKHQYYILATTEHIFAPPIMRYTYYFNIRADTSSSSSAASPSSIIMSQTNANNIIAIRERSIVSEHLFELWFCTYSTIRSTAFHSKRMVAKMVFWVC